MKNLKIFVLVLALGVSASLHGMAAGVEIPQTCSNLWQVLTSKALLEGSRTVHNYQLWFGLKSFNGVLNGKVDRTKAHTAHYFSLVGSVYNGNYNLQKVSVVLENWQVNERDNFEIDQYIVQLNTDGRIAQMARMFIERGREGSIYQYESRTVDEKLLNSLLVDSLNKMAPNCQ